MNPNKSNDRMKGLNAACIQLWRTLVQEAADQLLYSVIQLLFIESP